MISVILCAYNTRNRPSAFYPRNCWQNARDLSLEPKPHLAATGACSRLAGHSVGVLDPLNELRRTTITIRCGLSSQPILAKQTRQAAMHSTATGEMGAMA